MYIYIYIYIYIYNDIGITYVTYICIMMYNDISEHNQNVQKP